MQKHGQWVVDGREKENESWVCSICGEGRHSFENEMEAKEHPKVCPDCGAMMTDDIEPREKAAGYNLRHRYYVEMVGKEVTTSGYVWLTKAEYELVKRIADFDNWEELRFKPESGHFYIGPEG